MLRDYWVNMNTIVTTDSFIGALKVLNFHLRMNARLLCRIEEVICFTTTTNLV